MEEGWRRACFDYFIASYLEFSAESQHYNLICLLKEY